jgi:hypothetical protein
MTIWQNGKVDQIESWQIGKLAKCQVDKMLFWPNGQAPSIYLVMQNNFLNSGCREKKNQIGSDRRSVTAKHILINFLHFVQNNFFLTDFSKFVKYEILQNVDFIF